MLNSHCPERTGEKHKIYRPVFVACDESSLNMSSTSTSEEDAKIVCNMTKHFYEVFNTLAYKNRGGDLQ